MKKKHNSELNILFQWQQMVSQAEISMKFIYLNFYFSEYFFFLIHEKLLSAISH